MLGLPLIGAVLSTGDPKALKNEKARPLEASRLGEDILLKRHQCDMMVDSSLWALRTQHPADQILKWQPCVWRAAGSSSHLLGQEQHSSSYPFEELLPRNTKRNILRTGYFSTWQTSVICRTHGTLSRLQSFPSSSTHDPVRLAQAEGPGQLHTQLRACVPQWEDHGERKERGRPAATRASKVSRKANVHLGFSGASRCQTDLSGHVSWFCSVSAE